MSSDKDKTIAQLDKEAFDRYNKALEVSLAREAKLLRQHEWRGDKLPPFNIEHMPNQRERIAGTGMTTEDRALRHQWLKDQELAPNEPIFIPELYPQNPIRRMLAAPWNAVFGALRPVLGEHYASNGRYFVPKFAMLFAVLYAVYYQAKYNPNRWENKRGLNIHSTKPTLLHEGAHYQMKEESDFFDRGFKYRNVLRDNK